MGYEDVVLYHRDLTLRDRDGSAAVGTVALGAVFEGEDAAGAD